MQVKVAVPATVANLGPGFDILALALQLQNEVRAVGLEGTELTVDPGEAAPEELHDPDTNLVTRAFRHAERSLAAVPIGAAFTCTTRIPIARGLGSSAAAALAGVLTAVALHHAPWDEHDVLECVAELEGHRDNAAAALLGGLAVCAPGAPAVRVPVSDDLRAVLFIPEHTLSTVESRTAVPSTLSREDAVFNAARCALLVRAITSQDFAALGVAMEDRWHQAARSRLAPFVPSLISAARDAGAYGACLAGAGPSVLALTAPDTDGVQSALARAAAGAGVSGTTMALRLRDYGTRVDVRP